MLDNSDFRDPVNQRGKTSYTANGYTVDRWAIYKWSNDSSVSINLSVNNNGVSLTGGVSSASTPSSCYIYQKIDCTRLAGKTLTAAVYIENLSGTGTGIIGAYNDQTYIKGAKLNAGLNYISFDVPGSATVLMVMIGNDASMGGKGSITASISWAALYEGSYTADTLPGYKPKGYAAELAECQRYYNVIHPYEYLYQNSYVAEYTVYSLLIQFPKMRIIPTLQVDGNIDGYNYQTDSSLRFYSTQPNSIVNSVTLSADL